MSFGKFLNPKNDFCFKRIFGTEKHQGILIHFINDILSFEGAERIREVRFLKTAQDPEVASQKQSLVDVLCQDEEGNHYIIEMQVASTSGFEKRAQYYAAKAYSRQLEAGEAYHNLKAVIFIAITDFVMFPEKESYYSTHEVLDKETYSRDLKDFSFVFLELPKFKKGVDELETMLDKWAYFFKLAEKTEEKDLAKIVGNDQVIYEAYEALNRFSMDEIELNTYDESEKRRRDAQAILEQKIIEGEARGHEKGLKEGEVRGHEKGLKEGLEDGLKEGEARGFEKSLQAMELLRAGHSLDVVHDKTGIDVSFLEVLQASMVEITSA